MVRIIGRRVLVACECSGIVRTLFERKGWDAWSCDLSYSALPGNHLQCDVLNVLDDNWDLMIAHPPCTHLAVSGARHFEKKTKVQEEALEFFVRLLNAPIPQICIENPIGVASTRICKPTQIIQPYEYGDPARKSTCLWLVGLPPLVPTRIVKPNLKQNSGGKWYSHDHDPGRNRKMGTRNRAGSRSVTYYGIAEAMANQWDKAGSYCERSRKGIRTSMGYTVKERKS